MTPDEAPCHDNDNARIQGKGSSEAKSFEFLRKKYSIMKKELDDSRSRSTRVMYLEEREKHLVKEILDLREQLELMEFRIAELLEENQDKVRDGWMVATIDLPERFKKPISDDS